MYQQTAMTAPEMEAIPAGPAVLVVDDEPAFCTVVCEILRTYGFTAYPALNARQAITLLGELTPDLILTDVMMPDVDGLSMIRRLRSHPELSEIPTIVLSAKSEPEDLHAAFEAGADACLPKPFSAQELRDLVKRFS
jgi:CheY-like chemotaxis protein